MIYKSLGFRDRRGRLDHILSAIAPALLLLVGIDYLSGFFFRSSSEARVTTVRVGHNSVRRAIVILPGYLMSGSTVANAFTPYILPGNALVAVDYAERGVDLVSIYSEVRAALDSLRPQAVSFYGASMGGLIAARLAEIYARDGMPFGKITLVLDTAPMSAADVKRPGWLFGLSCVYRGGIASSVVLALLVLL